MYSGPNRIIPIKYLYIPAEKSLPVQERTARLNTIRIPCDAISFISTLLQSDGPPGFSTATDFPVIAPYPSFNECQKDNIPLFLYRRTENRTHKTENARAKQLVELFADRISKKHTTFYGDVVVFWRRNVDEMRHQMKLADFTLADIAELMGPVWSNASVPQPTSNARPPSSQPASAQTAQWPKLGTAASSANDAARKNSWARRAAERVVSSTSAGEPLKDLDFQPGNLTETRTNTDSVQDRRKSDADHSSAGSRRSSTNINPVGNKLMNKTDNSSVLRTVSPRSSAALGGDNFLNSSPTGDQLNDLLSRQRLEELVGNSQTPSLPFRAGVLSNSWMIPENNKSDDLRGTDSVIGRGSSDVQSLLLRDPCFSGWPGSTSNVLYGDDSKWLGPDASRRSDAATTSHKNNRNVTGSLLNSHLSFRSDIANPSTSVLPPLLGDKNFSDLNLPSTLGHWHPSTSNTTHAGVLSSIVPAVTNAPASAQANPDATPMDTSVVQAVVILQRFFESVTTQIPLVQGGVEALIRQANFGQHIAVITSLLTTLEQNPGSGSDELIRRQLAASSRELLRLSADSAQLSAVNAQLLAKLQQTQQELLLSQAETRQYQEELTILAREAALAREELLTLRERSLALETQLTAPAASRGIPSLSCFDRTSGASAPGGSGLSSLLGLSIKDITSGTNSFVARNSVSGPSSGTLADTLLGDPQKQQPLSQQQSNVRSQTGNGAADCLRSETGQVDIVLRGGSVNNDSRSAIGAQSNPRNDKSFISSLLRNLDEPLGVNGGSVGAGEQHTTENRNSAASAPPSAASLEHKSSDSALNDFQALQGVGRRPLHHIRSDVNEAAREGAQYRVTKVYQNNSNGDEFAILEKNEVVIVEKADGSGIKPRR